MTAVEQFYADLYWSVKREPDEGTATAAIKVHAQACGLVAFVLNVHPDAIARAVAEGSHA